MVGTDITLTVLSAIFAKVTTFSGFGITMKSEENGAMIAEWRSFQNRGGGRGNMTFFEAFKVVIGTLLYWFDKLVFGKNAYSKEYWQEG